MVPTQGVILAAGRGTRLGGLTETTPKSMIEIGGVPVITRIIEPMAASGVRRLTIVTGHLAEAVERHVALTSPLPVSFVRQEDRNGTAGAVAVVRSATGAEPFMLCWGDIVTAPEHYQEVAAAWRSDLAGVIGVTELPDVSAGSSVVFGKDHMITEMIEKPVGVAPSPWNNAGIMVFGAQLWNHVAGLGPSPRGELELPDAIASLLAAGESLLAQPLPGDWFDIGSLEDLAAARARFE